MQEAYHLPCSHSKSLLLWGGSLCRKFFFWSEHVSSQIWCQKIFPFTRRGRVPLKNFFSGLNMYQAKSGVKNFSLYWRGGGPSVKNFFSSPEHVFKPNLVSKIFPFTRRGRVPLKNFFFSQSEHVSSQIWCQKFFPLLGGGVPLQKFFFPV